MVSFLGHRFQMPRSYIVEEKAPALFGFMIRNK